VYERPHEPRNAAQHRVEAGVLGVGKARRGVRAIVEDDE
jgi:hypothetical protein